MGNKFLLIVDQPSGIAIWLGDRHRIGRDRPIKHFPTLAERKYHFAINEQQRLLAVAYIELTGQIFLQLLSMDETFSTIHALGSPHNVTAWYQDDPSEIQHVCFAGGHEELCLIERSGRIRIYSFVSLSFRGAMVQLPEGVNVTSIFSTPDDSALILVEEGSVNNYQLRLYHWNSFGQRPEGILLSTAEELRSPTSFSVSSIGERTNVVFVSLTPALNVMHGFNLQIESKNTAYAFRSKEGKSRNMLEGTVHNSLLDCHADVWTSYPIVSAIKRETVTSFSDIPHRLTFVCENSGSLIEEYFRRMVKEFENLTKKPTDHLLDGIQVSTKAIEELNWRILEARSFKAGEWLVELLCLIPIHIAVARHNTFIPLKDGVLDSRQEQRLLGATVDQITESITLGWYESILNSYMATKPIKVVSSMGEQSVGKSYMLNHFIDSSFAGSALRTTEGVWLSLCPTRDLLVVALDFEGVHSIERSPQEDMLLVLLNTAISNLVLFRNNFALSRDVAHMFTNLDNQQRIAWGNDTSEVSFCLSKSNADYAGPLSILIHQWRPEAAREDINKLTRYLEDCVTARIGHVRTWIDSNISRFPAESPDIRSLRVILADSEDLLRASVQLCQVDCNRCHLPCLYPKGHNLQSHDCQTSHQCLEKCAYASEHIDVDEDEDDTFCGLFAGHGGPHLCKPTSHSCGEPCKLRQHRGCQQTCMKLPRHPPDEDHICSARNHQCGEPCDLSGISVIDVDGNKDLYSCPNHCAAAYDEEHDHHVCSDKLTCPIKCQLCNRLCAGGDHLHGLFGDAKHLCGQEHTNARIAGIFACFLSIIRWSTKLGMDPWKIHFGPLKGIVILWSRFREEDMQLMIREPRIYVARSAVNWVVMHISLTVAQRRDSKVGYFLTGYYYNDLQWRRPDPYSREEQAEFSRCDIQCAGEEHRGHGSVPARPSFCTLPIFHPPQPLDWADGRNGYISSDGHSFSCANPNRRQSYHIIFVLDASYSMKGTDLKPLPATPTSNLIIQHQNNRFGAVLSALYNFCISRSAGGNVARGDSYSVITFGWSAPVVVTNDSTSTPDQLLQKLVQTNVWGKTHFDNALRTAKSTMETHWHNDRAPAIIFLSDGESTFTDSVMQELCNVAAARGKPLSFHTILFGDSQYSTSLKKMATIASQIAVGALRGPLASQVVPCGYSNALDSIKLAETFLNIAQSLKKPRAALMHS
ncbi:hypothetical protein FRC03_001516 [Tulasnella sp. 419]|nr:hypothetical protein FRC03_001516 [Tulasnella sp. 419]